MSELLADAVLRVLLEQENSQGADAYEIATTLRDCDTAALPTDV